MKLFPPLQGNSTVGAGMSVYIDLHLVKQIYDADKMKGWLWLANTAARALCQYSITGPLHDFAMTLGPLNHNSTFKVLNMFKLVPLATLT